MKPSSTINVATNEIASDESASTDALLVLRGISKAYPGCLANDNVDLSIGRGQIHGLIGENGAGKSTLVKILYGVLTADAGEYIFDGRRVTVSSPVDARRLGIAMVFQHFSLFEAMTALENIALGLPGERANAALAKRIATLSQDYNLQVDLDKPVAQLSVGERQRIEILRCLAQNPKLLVMDEPTSVLTPGEIDALMTTLERIRDEGRAVLFISHKLEEVRRICRRVTVLRQGRVVANSVMNESSDTELVHLMTGDVIKPPVRESAQISEHPLLRVRALSLPSTEYSPGLKDVTFDAFGGRILGIAGVAGNGQSELLTVLSGERALTHTQRSSNDILIAGQQCNHLSPGARRELGLAYVPEDRIGQASVPDMSLADNALLTARFTKKMAVLGVIRSTKAGRFARTVIDDYDVRCTGPEAVASSLSGGNLQKFILGREVMQNPRVLLVAHPTWGVDAGATASIRQRLLSIAVSGACVIVVSHDLDELLQIADQIAVMHRGELSDSHDTRTVNTKTLGLLMTGGRV